VFCLCLFDVKLREDELKKIETRRYISELYVKIYFITCAFLGVNRYIKKQRPSFGRTVLFVYFSTLKF
jgi:hypothetical protein